MFCMNQHSMFLNPPWPIFRGYKWRYKYHKQLNPKWFQYKCWKPHYHNILAPLMVLKKKQLWDQCQMYETNRCSGRLRNNANITIWATSSDHNFWFFGRGDIKGQLPDLRFARVCLYTIRKDYWDDCWISRIRRDSCKITCTRTEWFALWRIQRQRIWIRRWDWRSWSVSS